MLEVSVEHVELALNVVLLIRLFALHLGKVYLIFSAFLLSDLFASLGAALDGFHLFDYRTLYVCTRVVAWILSLWVIYALLNAILKNLPGILRYSKRLLNIAFAIAFVISVSAVAMSNAVRKIGAWRDGLNRVVAITYVVDQTIAVTVLLVLLVMLGFFLWFPVVVPRNLAVFSIGYVVYFSSITASLFLEIFRNSRSSPIISVILMLVTCVCYAYWAIFLSKAGERIPVRIGHRWQADEQQRLMHRLEEVNGVLLQTLANKKAI